ncbi:MAG: hypothetical protein HUU12_15550 [Anaerolineales bacterium]|nr:hypothetical protein [Anaerolineales bacterium]
MTDIKYEIVKTIGAVSKAASGWSKELKSGDKSKMGKGVTLTKEELLALRDLLNSLDL